MDNTQPLVESHPLPRSPGLTSLTYRFLFLALAILACGCTQAKYNARSLPQQFAAPKHISARHVDLTGINRNVRPSEWLEAGDQVEVTIATGIETREIPTWELTVTPNGQLDVPLVGTTPVVGIDASQAAERIRTDAIGRGLYIDPKVTVNLKKKRSFQVTVVGAVNKPDTFEIPASNADLLTALTMAEGVSDEASRFIQIRHSQTTLQNLAAKQASKQQNGIALASYSHVPSQTTINVDVSQLPKLDPESLKLFDGSVVSVQREPKRFVNVQGLVKSPKKVEMPDGEDLTLLDAIAEAGGTTLSVADKVYVTRNSPDSPGPVVIKASLSDARSGGKSNLRLAHGDSVSVAETPPTVVIQAIQTFFRVGFNAALPGN